MSTAKDSVWVNNDGLNVGFGTRDVTATGSGKLGLASGPEEKIVAEVNGADLADTLAVTDDFIVYGTPIPNGALITSAELIVETAFVGATATLDLGLYNSAGAAVDADGIDAAIAVTAIDALNDTIACDGADIGTLVATTGGVYVGASYNTAAFTAGKASLVVSYIPQ